MTSLDEDILKSSFVNLASPRLGTEVVFATDDFFADKSRLIQDSDPVWIADKYDDHGKWMDGWESRRRRDGGHDYAILRLGAEASIKAINIDTSHFTGNYPPAASLFGAEGEGRPEEDSPAWVPLTGAVPLGPNAPHLVAIEHPRPYRWLKLVMHPDGGIARLRVYGLVHRDWTVAQKGAEEELSALVNGGRIVGYNNAHYGSPWALLSAGRGQNMGDGWETRRRREPGNDWIIIALGCPGTISRLEVDTAHFKGNFPAACSIEAALIEAGTEASIISNAMFWKGLLEKRPLTADSQHVFETDDLASLGAVSHIKLNIYPDGGVSRLRLWGVPDVNR